MHKLCCQNQSQISVVNEKRKSEKSRKIENTMYGKDRMHEAPTQYKPGNLNVLKGPMKKGQFNCESLISDQPDQKGSQELVEERSEVQRVQIDQNQLQIRENLQIKQLKDIIQNLKQKNQKLTQTQEELLQQNEELKYLIKEKDQKMNCLQEVILQFQQREASFLREKSEKKTVQLSKQKSFSQVYNPFDLFMRIKNIQKVSQIFEKEIKQTQLLYQEGEGKEMQECLYEKKNLFLVCRFEDNTIFGGYSENGFYEPNDEVFIYVMQSNKNPIKIKPKKYENLISFQGSSKMKFGQELIVSLNKNFQCFVKFERSYSTFGIKKQILPEVMRESFKYASFQVYQLKFNQ